MKERLVRMRNQLIPIAWEIEELTIIGKIFKLKIGKFYKLNELKPFINATHTSKETFLEWKVFEKVENGVNKYGNMTYLYKFNGFDKIIEEMEKAFEEDCQEIKEFFKEQKEKVKKQQYRYFYPKNRENFYRSLLVDIDLSSSDSEKEIKNYTKMNYYEITLD